MLLLEYMCSLVFYKNMLQGFFKLDTSECNSPPKEHKYILSYKVHLAQ